MGTRIVLGIVLVVIFCIVCKDFGRLRKRWNTAVEAKRNTVKGEWRALAVGVADVRRKISQADEALRPAANEHFLKAEALFNGIKLAAIESANSEQLTEISGTMLVAATRLGLARKALGLLDDDMWSKAARERQSRE